MKIDWFVQHFNDLSVNDYHDLLALRTAVFVVEQNCPYQEVDDKDKVSFHVFGRLNDEVVAVARLLPEHVSYAECSIGRVATSENYRKNGLGRQLMEVSIGELEKRCPKSNIRISAQTYLQGFYESLGFKHTGKSYLEDGIPHIEMLLTKQSK